jgi:4-diphosphocytidyl-2-C-methyl-D-erythritol kinase
MTASMTEPMTARCDSELTERARAKVNLTLAVHGRRSDGFHELESLVTFADISDQLTLRPGRAFSLRVSGPFAAAIDGENLINRVIAALKTAEPRLQFGEFVLEKNLPVAAGIGGGSADAAAALRLIKCANPQFSLDWSRIASNIGADIPVCLTSETVVMRGFGERLTALPPVPRFNVVLVNACAPGIANKTAKVFRALHTGAVPHTIAPVLVPPWPTTRAAWIALLARHGNDLEHAATAIMPEIRAIRLALGSQPGSLAVQLSGAGPTCFAIYEGADYAASARNAIAAQHPDWWVADTTIG